MRRAAALILLVVSSLLAAQLLNGCGGQSCSLVGCAESVMLTLPSGMAPGSYTFQIGADEMNWTCTAVVPGTERPSCTGYDVMLTTDASGTAPEMIWLQWLPKTEVEVVVSRDGRELVSSSYPPKFERYYPNGEECDADYPCYRGRHAISWEEP